MNTKSLKMNINKKLTSTKLSCSHLISDLSYNSSLLTRNVRYEMFASWVCLRSRGVVYLKVKFNDSPSSSQNKNRSQECALRNFDPCRDLKFSWPCPEVANRSCCQEQNQQAQFRNKCWLRVFHRCVISSQGWRKIWKVFWVLSEMRGKILYYNPKNLKKSCQN